MANLLSVEEGTGSAIVRNLGLATTFFSHRSQNQGTTPLPSSGFPSPSHDVNEELTIQNRTYS